MSLFLEPILVKNLMNVPGKDVLGNLQDQMSLQDTTENIQVMMTIFKNYRKILKSFLFQARNHLNVIFVDVSFLDLTIFHYI